MSKKMKWYEPFAVGAFLEINLCYIATDGLALTVHPSLKLSANLLHRPPEFWNYWCLPPDQLVDHHL